MAGQILESHHLHHPDYLEEPSAILNDTVYLVTWAWRLVHHHTDRFRGDTFRGAVRGNRGRECLARAGSQRNGDRSQVGIQSLQIQQDAAAKTGPLDSEKLCHLLKTVIQGEASQRLPDSTSVSTDRGNRSQWSQDSTSRRKDRSSETRSECFYGSGIDSGTARESAKTSRDQ